MKQSWLTHEIHRTVLSNGMVVLTAENPAADIIAARIFIKAGSRCEPPAQAGISHLLSALLTKGTDKLTSMEIAEQVESVGASLSTDTAADYFLVSLKTVSADFREIIGLAKHLLREPSFPEAEIELERRLTIQGIRSGQEQPFAIAFDQLRLAMYQDHPYSMSSLGTETTVSQISRDDLQAYHQTYFRPDNMIISVVGRISPEEAIGEIQRVFGDWSAPAHPLIPPLCPVITVDPCHVITPQATQQSIVMLGYLSPGVHHPDYCALKLLNTYLGNGLSSRLFVELREKRGLAYEVSALYPTRLDQAPFIVYLGTAPENTMIAVEGLKAEVERLCQVQLTEDELQSSQNKLLGQYALGKQTNAQIAQILGWYETLGLGVEFDLKFTEKVSAVTAIEAQQIACKYFIEPYISLVGPENAVNKFAVPVVC